MTMSNVSVKRIKQLCFSLCLLLLGVIQAAGNNNSAVSVNHNDSGNFQSYKMTPIKTLVIKENGAWNKDGYSQDETPEMCKIFQIKEKDVKEYYRHAKQISYEQYDDPSFLYESRCYAAGIIEFANGDQGTWRIDFERRGLIILSDKRHLYFFCSKCRGKVFYPWTVTK